MTWPVARAILVTAFLCSVAAYMLISRRERKHEGIPPCRPRLMALRHPDRYAVLSDEERVKWDEIEAVLLGDAGVAIFDRDERDAP